MVFRKIPKKYDLDEIAAGLKATILYSDMPGDGVVASIAELMGISKRTVYSILDGQIKVSLDFLHAAVIATGGEPENGRTNLTAGEHDR